MLFQYCISVLILTFRRSSEFHFLRQGENAVVKGLPFSLLSLVAGWWGIPWGPIYTVQSIYNNRAGGRTVWRQALVENAEFVVLEKERYPVRLTPERGLWQVDFVFDGNEIRGLEQNPDTKSRWAQMARSGKKVMQFLSKGRYVANVVDGKVTLYGKRPGTGR